MTQSADLPLAHDEEDVPSSPVQTPTDSPWTWRKTVLVYAAIVVPLGTLSAFVVVVPMFAALALILIAVPYTAVVTYLLVRLRREAAAEAASSAPSVDTAAFRFATVWQRMSLINAGALGVVGVVALATMNSGSSVIFLAMELLAVLSAVEIVVNAPWIYGRQTAIAEAHAIQARFASARIIIISRRLSWCIWYAGSILAVVIVVNYAVTMIAAQNASIY